METWAKGNHLMHTISCTGYITSKSTSGYEYAYKVVFLIIITYSTAPTLGARLVTAIEYTIIKSDMHLISRVGLILIWPLLWIYYKFHAHILHKQVQFAYTKTYQVFLRVATSIRNVNTCSSITSDRNRST